MNQKELTENCNANKKKGKKKIDTQTQTGEKKILKRKRKWYGSKSRLVKTQNNDSLTALLLLRFVQSSNLVVKYLGLRTWHFGTENFPVIFA